MTTRTVSGSTYTFGYDYENRLTSVSGAATATFTYNGDGNRVKSVVGATTTLFVGSHYETSGGVITKYYLAGGTRVAMRKGSTFYWLLSDHLGSTSKVATSTGAQHSQQLYKAWGETRYTSGTLPTRYTYTGQYSYASDFGLVFYGSRFYDPLLGRFASPDSIIPQNQGTQAWDRYAYVNNSPVNYTDPTGHIANRVIGGLVGGIVGGALYLVNEVIRQDGFDVSEASDWRDLGTSVLQGSVAGLLVATPGGQAAGLGMTSSLIGDHASNLLTGTDYNAVTTTIGALAGAATGSLNKGVISLGQKAINSGILNGGANTLEQSLLGQDTDVGDFFSNFAWSAGSTYFSGDYSRSLQNPTLNPIAVPTTKFQAELTSAVFTPSLRSWVKDEFIPFIHSAE